MTTTEGSRAIITSIAEFNAWIMFIWATALLLRRREPELGVEFDFVGELFALPAQIFRELLVDVLEHEVAVETRAFVERAEGHGFLPGRHHLRVELRVQILVLLLAPLAARNEMVLQSVYRVAQRPMLVVVLRPVTRRVVAGRVGRRAIRHEF